MYRKVVQFWCIFDIICCLVAFCTFIWLSATEEQTVSFVFGSGAALFAIMSAIDVFLFLAILRNRKLFFRIWQIFTPIFAAVVLFIIDFGLGIHVLYTFQWKRLNSVSY